MADVTPPVGVLSNESWLRRETVLRRFEDAWRNGAALSIDDVLNAETDADAGLLVELVHLDMEYRIQAGEAATFAEYQKRFPQLAHCQPDTLDHPDGDEKPA